MVIRYRTLIHNGKCEKAIIGKMPGEPGVLLCIKHVFLSDFVIISSANGLTIR